MRPRNQEKEQIIREKAFEMFFQLGFSGFSMQKLAKAAQVSPATLYIYFKDKDDLILKLYAEEMQKMTDATLEGFDPNLTFAHGLKIQWLNRARYIRSNPLPAHFLEQVRFTPYHDQAMRIIDPHFLNQMKCFIQQAIENSQLAKIPVEIYWAVAFAPLYQLLKFELHSVSFAGSEPFIFDDQKLMTTLEMVIAALKPNAAHTPAS